MQMKVGKRVIPGLLLVSVLLLGFEVSSVGAVDSSIWGVKAGDEAQWLIMPPSNVTIPWYGLIAPVGSKINLTITSTVGGTCNGNASVGNLDLADTSMSVISFILLLGWYPFDSGLVCPVNWDVQKKNATDNGFTVEESKVGDIETMTFKHLSGANGTMLVYDKATGLLVHGYGNLPPYLIEVVLISTTIDVGSVQSDYQALGATYVIVEIGTMMGAAALVIIFIVIFRRSRGGK